MTEREPFFPPNFRRILRHTSWRLLLRFLCGGLLNTAFGYMIFVSSLAVGLPVAAALVVSTTVGVFFNFNTARRLVFQSEQDGLLLRFIAVYLILLVPNYIAIKLMQSAGMPNWASQALLVGPMALAALVAQRIFVFRSMATR